MTYLPPPTLISRTNPNFVNVFTGRILALRRQMRTVVRDCYHLDRRKTLVSLTKPVYVDIPLILRITYDVDKEKLFNPVLSCRSCSETQELCDYYRQQIGKAKRAVHTVLTIDSFLWL